MDNNLTAEEYFLALELMGGFEVTDEMYNQIPFHLLSYLKH